MSFSLGLIFFYFHARLVPFDIRTLIVHCTPPVANFGFVACHRNFVFAVLLWLNQIFSHQILHFLRQIVGLKGFSCPFKDFYPEKLQESYYWLYSLWNGTHSSFCKTPVKNFHREMLKCKHNCSVICNIFSCYNMCMCVWKPRVSQRTS